MMRKILFLLLFMGVCWPVFAEPISYTAEKEGNVYRFHTAHRYFKGPAKDLRKIDTRLIDGTGGWYVQQASYQCFLPEYADGVFRFRNLYEDADHTIKAKALNTAHVQGVVMNDQTDGHYVLYSDAFGKGIHLKTYAYHSGIKKVIIIESRDAVDVNQDYNFDFGMEFDEPLDFVRDNNTAWDKTADEDFEDRTIRIKRAGQNQASYMRNAIMWNSGTLERDANDKIIQTEAVTMPVPIRMKNDGTRIFIRKTVPSAFLKRSVYPVMTDHPTNYYAGAGDGHVFRWSVSRYYNPNYLTMWNETHDASAGGGGESHVDVTTIARSMYDADWTGYLDRVLFYRSFVPIDTSGIDDGATVTGASLFLYATALNNDDDDANAYIGIVETAQASTDTLELADFTVCGDAVDNPTQGATALALSAISTSAYNEWILNETGIGWIDKTGVSKFGVREGHDIVDNPLTVANQYLDEISGLTFSTSEDTSGTQDPYLEVTVSGGGGGSAPEPQPILLVA